VEIFKKRLNFKSRKDSVILLPIGDLHHMKVNQSKKQLREVVKWVKENPNVYVIEVGDSADFIATSDKRFSASGLPDELLTGTPAEIRKKIGNVYKHSLDELIKELSPIKDRILLSVTGNHEGKVLQYHHFDAQAYKCEGLGIPNGKLSCFLNLHLMRSSNSFLYRIFVKHAPPGGAGRTAGAKYNALEKMIASKEVDIVICGHTHAACYLHQRRETTTISDPPRLALKDIYAVNVGSFTETLVEGVETYEEERGYRSNPIILHKIIITPFGLQPRIDIEPWHIR